MEILGSVPVVSHNYLVFGKLQTFPVLVETLRHCQGHRKSGKKEKKKDPPTHTHTQKQVSVVICELTEQLLFLDLRQG